MSNWLARTWRKRGLAAHLLWPVSVLYGVLTGLHRWVYRTGFFKSERCAVPVIVVGNIVAGGAGKTPLVIALVKHFQGKGMRVGVVSRGFGRQGKHCQEVLSNTPILESGDEAALILRAQGAPVFVANNRFSAVRALLAKYPETQLVISDDGLQHHSLARDIEIIVFDDRGLGNGWLLPAGPLRQRWGARAALKAGLVLHTGQSPAFEGYASTRRLADFALTATGQQVSISSLQGRPINAIAGIANPQAFFDMLSARGIQLQQAISLPDHYDFSRYKWPLPANQIVLCTEKDAVKLFELPLLKGYSLLAVPLEFSPEPAFLIALDALLALLLAKASDPPPHQGHENGHQIT